MLGQVQIDIAVVYGGSSFPNHLQDNLIPQHLFAQVKFEPGLSQ